MNNLTEIDKYSEENFVYETEVTLAHTYDSPWKLCTQSYVRSIMLPFCM